MIGATACGGAVHPAAEEAGATYGTVSRPGATASSAAPESGPASRSGRPADPSGKPMPSRTAVVAAALPSRTTAPASAPVPACAARDLTASEGRTGLPAGGRPGWFATRIELRNHSEPRSFSVARTSARTLPDVSLAPAGTTSFTLVWQGSFSCDAHVDSPYGIDIRVPGDSRALTVIPAAAFSPCDEHLEVTPFGITA
ncbi:hypothetical protein ACWGI9_00975 [Streptomyces sp. NPDC054833]